MSCILKIFKLDYLLSFLSSSPFIFGVAGQLNALLKVGVLLTCRSVVGEGVIMGSMSTLASRLDGELIATGTSCLILLEIDAHIQHKDLYNPNSP